MGTGHVPAPPPRIAERKPTGDSRHAQAGRSDLGAGIRTLQGTLRQPHTDGSEQRSDDSTNAEPLGQGRHEMKRPTIGFAGMTHLGLVSATAIAAKGLPTVCYDPDRGLIQRLLRGEWPVHEPDLASLRDASRPLQQFSADLEASGERDVVYISPDVPSD